MQGASATTLGDSASWLLDEERAKSLVATVTRTGRAGLYRLRESPRGLSFRVERGISHGDPGHVQSLRAQIRSQVLARRAKPAQNRDSMARIIIARRSGATRILGLEWLVAHASVNSGLPLQKRLAPAP